MSNPNIIDEENTDILVSDNNIFYADEIQETELEPVEETNSNSLELTEKDFEDDYCLGPKQLLLDEIKDEDDEEEQEQKKKISKKEEVTLTPLFLLDELLRPEKNRVKHRFLYDGKKYHGYVVAQLKSMPNRFVFNMLPENKLKAININDVKLI